MKKVKYLFAALAASVIPFLPLAAGCSRDNNNTEEDEIVKVPEVEIPETETPKTETPKTEIPQQPEIEVDNKPKVVTYFTVTSDGVNIRSGAGTGYGVRGQAEKSTLYAFAERSGDWFKTEYRNREGYISSKYCTFVDMPISQNEQIEAVIAEGTKLLGTPYVYGATRLHDGRGNFYKSFTTDEFDCSSLMQYIFYRGAGILLDVNTRTQVYQGDTVTWEKLERGDLMFFTNASRKNNKGVERIGHVALYLGDNYILHTASDYAKIEKISSTRRSYFIQGQRII